MMLEQENINNEENAPKTGELFVVSTPIGNDDDITLRALKVLRSCDLVICEEAKIGARMLHKYNVSQKMELLNEQNEFQKSPELLDLLKKGKSLALTSDAGTPVFADPGYNLVKAAIANKITVTVVPGASSIMTALVRSGFSLNQFVYAGFLSRLKEERLLQLERLAAESRTTVLLETPYRLMPFLEAAKTIMPDRQAYLGCNLTLPFETHHYGTFSELYDKFKDLRFRGEFVVCIDGAPYIGEESVRSFDRSGRRNYESREGRAVSGIHRRRFDTSDQEAPRRFERKPYERSERRSNDDRAKRSYDKPRRDSIDRFGKKPYEKSERSSSEGSERKPYDKPARKTYKSDSGKPKERSGGYRKDRPGSDRKGGFKKGNRKPFGK